MVPNRPLLLWNDVSRLPELGRDLSNPVFIFDILVFGGVIEKAWQDAEPITFNLDRCTRPIYIDIGLRCRKVAVPHAKAPRHWELNS